MAPKLIQCIKFSFSLTAGARFRWTNNKSVPHSSSVFACRWGKNTRAPSIVYRLLIGWNCHTTWSQGNLHYMRLHFLKLWETTESEATSSRWRLQLKLISNFLMLTIVQFWMHLITRSLSEVKVFCRVILKSSFFRYKWLSKLRRGYIRLSLNSAN